MSINSVTASGNLGADPEMRQTAGGTAVMSFRLAVNERRKNQYGEWEDRCNWVPCTIFGNRASGLAPYLHKGDKVCVHGRLRYEQWEKDGASRSKLEVIVDEIEFMAPRAAQSAAQPQYQPQPTNYQPQPQQPAYAPQNAPQGYQHPANAAQMAMQMAQQQPQQQPGEVSVFDSEIPF